MSLSFKQRALIKLNYKLFVDMHFLRDGCYSNIASGQVFYDGSDPSVLLPDMSADDTLYGVSNGQVWQSPFRNWVYETGTVIDGPISKSAPTMPSGVYVEGAFRAQDDAEFGHVVDYINGRIIFNSPISVDTKVNCEFAAREVRVGFENDFNNQNNTGFLESKFTTNPLTSNQIVYPSGQAYPFPAVFIEVDNRTFNAYELGNRSQIIEDTIYFHIWALDDIERDNIVDLLTEQVRKVVPIIDFNMSPLPLSGIYNTKSFEYIPYQNLLTNERIVTSVGVGRPIKMISYIEEVTALNVESFKEFERARVSYKVRTYLNAPNQTIGTLFGPISSLPTIEDSQF